MDNILDMLSFHGGELKYLGETENGGAHVGGYLVTFTDASEPDSYGDYFTAETDFGFDATKSLGVFFHHSQPLRLRDGGNITIKDPIGEGKLTQDIAGLLIDAIIYNRQEYERAISEQVKSLGWSSGALGHMVERAEPDENGATWIKRWVIGEASLTPTPAERKNSAIPIKSLIASEVPAAAVTEPVADDDATKSQQKTLEDHDMDENTIQKMVADAIGEALPGVIGESIKAYEQSQKEVKAGYVTGVDDEADRAAKGNPFKSGGEFLMSVKNAELNPTVADKRLFPLKATGMNEAIPSQGGFLVPPQFAAGIVERMYDIGQVLSRVSAMDVTGNSMTINAVDETSRVDGSRLGGIQQYWLAEAGTKTASKPKFRQIDLKLKKEAVLCYATDELLDDAAALDSWLMNAVPDELMFGAEDAIYNGDGVGKPLGIMNSPALVSVTREDASQIDTADIVNMMSRRWAGARNYVWLINTDVLPQLYQMTLGNYPVYMPAGGLSSAPFSMLMGLPVIEIEYGATLGTTGDIMLASLAQYQIIRKGGVQAASSIHVAFTTDETAFRFVYRIDGEPLWNAPLTPFKGTNTKSPFVVLSTSS